MSEKKGNDHAGHRHRMRKRFIEHGFEGFEQHQILEKVLYYAIPRKDTNLLAHQMLKRYGSFAGVCDTPIDVLQDDFGLSESAAVLLKMLPALAGVYADSKHKVKSIDKQSVIPLFRSKFIGANSEKVALALSDAKDKLIFCDVIFNGSFSAAELSVRTIADYALRHNARYAYLAHNHPSELFAPSKDDLRATNVISRTLDNLGIMLVDHIIFTSTEHFSMRSNEVYAKVFVR